MSTTETDWISEIGAPADEAIREMVAALQCDYDRLQELADRETDADDPLDDDERAELADLRTVAGECESEDDARERIDEDPLDIEIRGYLDLASGKWTADEFSILLTTGGPAVRIVGDLDRGQPSSPRLQVQDWGKPWTEYLAADRDALQAYCECLCFE